MSNNKCEYAKQNEALKNAEMTDTQMDQVAGGFMASGCNCNAGRLNKGGKIVCSKCGYVFAQVIL